MKESLRQRPKNVSVRSKREEYTLTMMETYSTRFGISEVLLTQAGPISWANAPPKGFAKLMTAVAATLPRFVNHKSEYRDGAESTKGCANPIKICPNIRPPKFPCFPAFVAPYLIQLPIRSRTEEIMMAVFGPPRWSVKTTTGDATTNEKRNAVLIQLMLEDVTL